MRGKRIAPSRNFIHFDQTNYLIIDIDRMNVAKKGKEKYKYKIKYPNHDTFYYQ